MNRVLAMMIYLVACSAWAQSDQTPAENAGAPATSAPVSARSAPLANAEELEPAADVGDITQPAAPRAPQAPAASASAPATSPSRVVDTLDLGTTSITGNQELPKVLYIVPWKKADLGDLVGRPVNTLLDEVLEPVDPDVFERSLEYYETLYGSSHKE
jgi:hypothetical protein